MYRVYFDWNVLSNLKSPSNAHYEQLLSLVHAYRSRLWIPYSSAHLRDLGRGYDASDPEKVRYTYRDLGFLGMMTEGVCFQKYFGEERARRTWREPAEFFEDIQEQQAEMPFDLGSMFSVFEQSDSPIMQVLGGQITLLWQTTIDYPTNAPPFLDELFPAWRATQTVAGVLEDTMALLARMQSDFAFLEGLRAQVATHIPSLSPRNVSGVAPENAFARIEELLRPILGGKSFFEMVAGFTEESGQNKKSLEERFTDSYFQLDMFGYRPEKLSAKNHMPNIIDDITHAFLAAHCDLFVAEDKTLRAKAAAVYAQYGVRTRICTPGEAVTVLTDLLTAPYTAHNLPGTLARTAADALQNGYHLARLSDESKGINCFYFGWRLLDRFNTVRVIRGDVKGTEFQFLSLPGNFADSVMTEELADLVASLVNCLGVDDKGKGLLQTDEWKDLGDGAWSGRRWSYQEFTVELYFDADTIINLSYWPILKAS